MKTFVLLPALLLLAAALPAQEKGAAPLNPQSVNPQSVIRAVVIGISDYQDPGIPDLQFAHRDAEAFAAWLQSAAGGSVPPENIQLLLNEKATQARVAMAFTALMQQCREDEQAIIFFSGHGDTESKLISRASCSAGMLRPRYIMPAARSCRRLSARCRYRTKPGR